MKTLYTRWGKDLDTEHVLSEYPRPLMRRKSYINLNGYWDYRICRESGKRPPASFEGKILVPFSPESVLSGVKRRLRPEETLWYHRTFENPAQSGERILLHFGAVDQMCVVYINGRRAGCHKGGYLPFTVDVTRYLKEGENDLCVRVRDISDQSWHAKGKQKIQKAVCSIRLRAESGRQYGWRQCRIIILKRSSAGRFMTPGKWRLPYLPMWQRRQGLFWREESVRQERMNLSGSG